MPADSIDAPHTSMDTEVVNGNNQSEVNEPTFTPADRIRELLSIDTGVTEIVKVAGLSVQTLISAPPAADITGDAVGMEALKTQFQKLANEYVVASQSVTARLRRQVYALEEAKIIAMNRTAAEPQQTTGLPAQPAVTARLGPGVASQQTKPPMHLTNGGLGKLDVGWLNSRIDRVGKQKEAELWAQARELADRSQTSSLDGNSKDGMDLDD